MKFLKLPNDCWINLHLITRVCSDVDDDTSETIVEISFIASISHTYLKGESAIALLKVIDKHSSPAA